MPILEWHDRVYATGIPAIDRQHRILVEMINTAHDRGWRQDDGAALRQVIRDMVRYASEHFAVEERLMTDAGYPGISDHLRAHREFTVQAKAYQEGAVPVAPSRVFRFLAEWLSGHILEVDSVLGSYLRERGLT